MRSRTLSERLAGSLRDQRRGELRVRAGRESLTANVDSERISTARYHLLPPSFGRDSLRRMCRSSISQIVDLSAVGRKFVLGQARARRLVGRRAGEPVVEFLRVNFHPNGSLISL